MTASVFDHPWMGALFAAPDIARHWAGDVQLAHMLAFERAYTSALCQVGRIDEAARDNAIAAMDRFTPDHGLLARGTARDGLVVPALVRELRVLSEYPDAIHTGSTSQDVLDTACVLTLRHVAKALRADLKKIQTAFSDLDTRFGSNRIMGRTRMQAALPIAVSTRLATWAHPIDTHIARLEQLGPRVFRLQFGGAAGDNQGLGTDAATMAQLIARDLDLDVPVVPWQSARDGIVEYGNWLALIAGHLGKIGQDAVSYTHLRAHETRSNLVCRLLLEKKKRQSE